MAPKYSEEKTKLLAEHGWDKGLVFFGMLASETTVRVSTALHLVCQQDNFPYSYDDVVFVEMTIDDKPIQTKKNGSKSVGTVAPEWLILSEGKHYMPAVIIEGTMYTESAEIVKMLHTKYPDTSLSAEENKQVVKWIDSCIEFGDRVQDAERHWGWCHFTPQDKGNHGFGEGNKDLAWEKERIQLVDKFCKTQDEHFASYKEVQDKAYFVGNKQTLADCVMIGFPLGLYHVASLQVKTRYPHLWEHHVALKATKPKGAEEHYKMFPFVGVIVSVCGMWRRGIINYGFHIENPKYWE